MWYSNLYRRHLIDMHIEDWDEGFLSHLSPEEYVNNLVSADINYAMLYAQSHVGLCYYPTKTGDMHKAFDKNPAMMKEIVDLCHKNNIKTMGYYSLIYNTREHDKNPSWRMVTESGKSKRSCNDNTADKSMLFQSASGSRYGFCCPNNQDYIGFVYAQIDEILDYFDFDALFFDMPFFAHTCYCENCKKKYFDIYNEEMPINPSVDSEEYLNLTSFKQKIIGEFISSVTKHIKEKSPNMPVEYNFASSLVANSSFKGCGFEVADASDFIGGDLYGDQYHHSFVCKFLKANSKNQPFENMISRCKPALQTHTLSKTFAEIKTSMAITMAHHGASLVIDAIDPVGTVDKRVYKKVKEAFDFEKQYEEYFCGEMREEIGLYWGFKSNANTDVYSNKSGCMGFSRTLTANHIMHGVCSRFLPLSKYKIIVAPSISAIEDGDIQRLKEYVSAGGTLYISGFDNPVLFEELTGNKLLERDKQIHLYISPRKEWNDCFGDNIAEYPLPFTAKSKTPIVQSVSSEIVATLTYPYTRFNEAKFASIHSNPPGIFTDIPVITLSKYGKGKVVWSALPIESAEHIEYGNALLKILSKVSGFDSFIKTNAPANVELTAFESENEITVNAVILNNEFFEMQVYPFEISIRSPKAPKNITLLPNGSEIDFNYQEGIISFMTQKLKTFDMYKIEF